MSFNKAWERTIGVEGSYSDHEDDLGGETMWGITEALARRHGYEGEMADLTRHMARTIAREEFWVPMRLKDVEEIADERISAELFDTAYNVGSRVAGKFLQRFLNVMNQKGVIYDDLKVDGIIGPKTLRALRGYVAHRGSKGVDVLHVGLNCLQGAKYIEFAKNRVANESFVYGWLRHRVINDVGCTS